MHLIKINNFFRIRILIDSYKFTENKIRYFYFIINYFLNDFVFKIFFYLFIDLEFFIILTYDDLPCINYFFNLNFIFLIIFLLNKFFNFLKVNILLDFLKFELD